MLIIKPFVNGAISAAYTLGCFDTILDTDEKLTSAEEIAKKNGAEKLIVGSAFMLMENTENC